MWETWTKLAEANVDHFNEHPAAHNFIVAATGVAAAVVMSKMFLRLAKDELDKAPNE